MKLVLAIFTLMGVVLLITEVSVRHKFKRLREDPRFRNGPRP